MFSSNALLLSRSLGRDIFLFLHYTKICNTHDYYMLHIFMTITYFPFFFEPFFFCRVVVIPIIFMTITYFRVHTTLHSLPHLSTLTATPLCTETATPLSVRSLPRLTIISHDYFIFSCNALLFFQTPFHCCCDIILR